VRDYEIGRDEAKRDLDIFLQHLSEMDALDSEENDDKGA
jgi:hypothetical protein